MNTTRTWFTSLIANSSNVCDKICAIDLFKAQIPALRAPDVLRGYVRTRVTGLLTLSNGLAAQFERHPNEWSVTIPREFPLLALTEFGTTWRHEAIVDHPHVPESHTAYLYRTDSLEELAALVELLKQTFGPALPTTDPTFALAKERAGWGESELVPPFRGKGCLRSEIRALRIYVEEIALTHAGAVWAKRHETCLNDGDFGIREAYLLKILRLAEGGLAAEDTDVSRARKELTALYQERVRWAKRLLDLNMPHSKEALVLITLDLERSQRQRASMLKKLGRDKQQRSALADAAAVLPKLIEYLEAARDESAEKYAEAQHPWWGRRLSFFNGMLAKFQAVAGDREAAARARADVATLLSFGHSGAEWVERWA